jgi:MFS family permease
MSADSRSSGSSPFELMRGRNALRSFALAGGVALHATNVYVVTTIMPSIVRSIGGLEYYAWGAMLFVIASILGSALSVRLIGSLGPRRAYLWGLAIFCLGSAVCATAPVMVWLLVGRTLQGLAGGILLALSYALIRLVYEPRLWSRALAFISAMWGVATLSGPTIGGIFAEAGSWRAAFWSLLPVAAVLALIVARLVPARQEGDVPKAEVPWVKLVLLAVSVLAISVGSLFDDLRWNALGLLAGLALGVTIGRMDMTGRVRLLPTGAYTLRSSVGACYATMAALVMGLTTEIFVPYFLQTIHGFTPLTAGYLTAVMAGGWTIAALMFAGYTATSTKKRLIRTGPCVVAAALALLAAMMRGGGFVSTVPGLVLLCAALGATGFGVGMCWSHLVTRVFTTAPAGQENLASSAVITVQLYAMSIGAACAGLVANAAGLTEPGGVEGARNAATYLFGAFALMPAIGIFTARGALR